MEKSQYTFTVCPGCYVTLWAKDPSEAKEKFFKIIG